MDLDTRLEGFRQQYPDIRPFEEEDDIHWWNQGLELIDAGDLDAAEETFQKLVLAQPEHSDGFNGLGRVYARKRDRPAAELFLHAAIAKAEQMVRDGHMDAEVLDLIRGDLDRLLRE
jgi:tetratricopeptide (TPR) repeat protein